MLFYFLIAEQNNAKHMLTWLVPPLVSGQAVNTNSTVSIPEASMMTSFDASSGPSCITASDTLLAVLSSVSQGFSVRDEEVSTVMGSEQEAVLVRPKLAGLK